MKDRRNFIIAALLFAVVMMSVGYATFSANLQINGTATIDPDSKWSVEITGINGTTTGDASAGTPTSTTTTASFAPVLQKPGDSATYIISIQNKGTIDAKLSNITLTPATAEAETAEADDIIFTVIEAPAKNTVLTAGSTTTVTVTVKYNKYKEAAPTVTTKDFSAIFEYVQAD